MVNEIFAAGDGNHGVQTAAYNLPNDERVVEQKGSKRVMLKNVQEAKFKSVSGADFEARCCRALRSTTSASIPFLLTFWRTR